MDKVGNIFKTDIDYNMPFNKFIAHNYFKYKDTGLMVDIGCGDKKIAPEFIGVDPYVDHEDVNIHAFMWYTPFTDNSVDFLVCFSAMEHISKYNVVPTLNEFARILKPGGSFAILVPNLSDVMIRWLKNPTNEWELDLIFGLQTHDGEAHRTGFSVDIIKKYFDLVPALKLLNIYDVNAYEQINYGIIGEKL